MDLSEGFVLLAEDLGRELGRGASKTAFELRARPDRVVVIHRDSGRGDLETATDERERLDKLIKAGVPTAPILALGTVNIPTFSYDHNLNGGIYGAQLMKRYASSNRCNRREVDRVVGLLNERSIASATAIYEALVEADLYVFDLQFLIDEDGSVVVSDPLDVQKMNAGRIEETREVCEEIIAGAEYSKSKDRVFIDPDNIYCFTDLARNYRRDNPLLTPLRDSGRFSL